MKGDVDEWKVWTRRTRAMPLPTVPRPWLERNGFHYYLYVGEAALRWDLCPREKALPGIELELEGAPDPRTLRLSLR